MREHPLWQMTLNRWRDFYRQPETIFWVFAFPLLLAIVLGIAFRNKGPETLRIAVEAGAGADSMARMLAGSRDVRATVLPPAEAARQLKTGKVVLVVVAGDPLVYRYDSTRAESRVARLATDDVLQRGLGRRDARSVEERKITERGSRYIDFLIPGLLGLNLMGTGMWGVGFAIVQVRAKKLLKRLVASPMKRPHYLLSYMIVRVAQVPLEVAVLIGFAVLAFDVPVRGSPVALLAVAILGCLAFSGLGLLVASRAQTVEGVAGLMNVVMLPMWGLSGVFFSSANFPDAMQPLIRVLPLTALNDALRAIMIDGASVTSQAGELGIVAAWGVVSFGIAMRIFRWL